MVSDVVGKEVHQSDAADELGKLLVYVLDTLITQTQAAGAVILRHSDELDQTEVAASSSGFSVSADCARSLFQRTHQEGQFQQLYPLTPESGCSYAGATCWIHRHGDEAIGGLVLFFHHELTPDSFPWMDDVQPCLGITRALLENQRLKDEQSLSDTIQEFAQLVGENPTPQHMINLLAERLFGGNIRFCALLLYGPFREDRPNGPFGYLEIQGSWSSQNGSGVAAGMKIYLDQYPDMLAEIERKQIFHIPTVKAIETRLDPLARGMLKAAGVQSLLLIALGTRERKVGLMVIGTQHDQEFSLVDIRRYSAVSKFVAMSAVTKALQQQHDYVHRARSAILDAVTDGVALVLPMAGHPNGGADHSQVLTVNPAFTELFGVPNSRAQVPLTQLLARMRLPDDVRQSLDRQWFSRPLRDPITQTSEFLMVHPNGHPVTIEWYSAPVYQDRQVIGRIFLFHDVTNDRSSVNLRADFIQRMSHELRTPLTSIKGFAQFILEELQHELSPLAKEYTSIIYSNAQQLTSLFSSIIEMTRADTGELRLNTGPTHIGELVQKMVDFLEPECITQEKRIINEVPFDLPLVLVDANRINQVLQQLLNNALKHTPPQGEITIQGSLAEHAMLLPPDAPDDVVTPCLVISIIDQGTGISAEDAPLIFLPFYRTKESRAAKLPGSGLGLRLVQSVIELHRGKIWAGARRRGHPGGRIHFTLPTQEQDA
jgi:signal transduction histidine kinase